MNKGSCTVECRSTDGRGNCKDLFLQEGDQLILEGTGGVVLSYSATTADPATVITITN